MQITYADLHNAKMDNFFLKQWKKLFPAPVELDEKVCRKCAYDDFPLGLYLKEHVHPEIYAEFEQSRDIACKAHEKALYRHMRLMDEDFSGPRALYHERIYKAYLGLLEGITTEVKA